ncbi:MAG: HNH endonuclease family protein, partial [Bacteroidales bacterium]|nr:HNH endonuclease family protein [Bacteroidales bacterium]
DDQQLYDPNNNKIDEFVKFVNKRIKSFDVPQLWQLYQAITKSLKIVWIPLDENKDDAQAIFESLNDAGMPLSASELLCNYIFRPLTNDATNEHEKLHNEKWLAARKLVGENNFEEYLRNLFSIGEKKRVGKERRMYVHFKIKNKKLTADSAKSTLDKIFNYTTVYNHITKPIQIPHSNEEIKAFLILIYNTNMSSINPFLMGLLKAFENNAINEVDTLTVLRETYVLLVRRKVTKLPVTKYDTFFPGLIDKIINEPNKVKAFQTQVQTEQLWVADQVFEDAFLTKEVYNSRELNFSRLILQELDKSLQAFGELPDYSTIHSIEHILPQTLDEHWKNYLGDDATNINLPTIINTIGNLSLNSGSANSSFGKQPFAEKQEAYTKACALARDVKQREQPWNIASIEKRSSDLSKIALKVWKWNI